MQDRYGITIPLEGPLGKQADAVRELADLGYADLWSLETDDADGFTPLVLASQWAPGLRLGVAIIPAYTRGPALMAQSVASMCEAAPGRFVMGLGSSSRAIVEDWNDVAFVEPYKRARDMVRFLRTALTGERVTETYDSFTVNGFTLRRVPDPQPPIFLAALRPQMLGLAGRVADGVILTSLSADDIPTVVAPFLEHGGEGKEVVARLVVCPSTDAETVRGQARWIVAAMLNAPVYMDFHRWLGRSERLQPMWDAWATGDRKAALDAIPDSVIDELFIHGTVEECREHIDRYHDNGVDTSTLAVLPLADIDVMQAARDLSPAARR